MEGYDNMDNNLNNGSGIPNVSDIKFDDTPAESFENLYGGQNQNNNVGMNNDMNANASMGNVQVPNSGIAQAPVQPQMQSPVEPQTVQSNVGVSVNNVAGSMSNVQTGPVSMDNNIGVNPQVVPNPALSQQPNNVGVQAQSTVEPQVVQPNVGVSVNPASNVQPQPAITNPSVPNFNQEPVMTPNPVNVNNNGVPVSNVNIDAEKMQSIEEQLSKTSQYNPSDFQQEQIVIPTDNQSDKSKSGLAFVIVLFILLGVAIVFMPQITKMIK